MIKFLKLSFNHFKLRPFELKLAKSPISSLFCVKHLFTGEELDKITHFIGPTYWHTHFCTFEHVVSTDDTHVELTHKYNSFLIATFFMAFNWIQSIYDSIIKNKK